MIGDHDLIRTFVTLEPRKVKKACGREERDKMKDGGDCR